MPEKPYICRRKKLQNMMNKIPNSLLCLLAVCLLSGCSAERITLFSASSSAGNGTFSIPAAPCFRLEAGDIVSINFFGPDQETVRPFNISKPDYVVAPDGSVTLPVVGGQRIAGMTEREAEQALEQAAARHLRNPTVKVRLKNVQVTVLGEVDSPGTFDIERPVTLLAALGMAGDLLPNARRDNILIQRQEDGKVKQFRVNLLTDELFASPCYYLHKGDVVYVSPRHRTNRAKKN